MTAAAKASPAVVELLLKANGNVNATNNVSGWDGDGKDASVVGFRVGV